MWAITPGDDRLAMVELAIAGNDRFVADRLELDREGPSYTVDTLEALRARTTSAGAEPDLTLILSSEAFRELPTWHTPHRIFELARIAVAPREGYGPGTPSFMDEELARFRERVTYLDGPRIRLSASELRGRAAATSVRAGGHDRHGCSRALKTPPQRPWRLVPRTTTGAPSSASRAAASPADAVSDTMTVAAPVPHT